MGKGRAPCCDKSKVKKGSWSRQEDLTLITFIQKHGHRNWRSLPKQAGLMRCGKSCRLRWINYLRPDVKRGNFTKEEEDAIIHLHQTLGNKWSKIASFLPGRTDNEIKNVWNTHLKKRLTSTSSPPPSSSSSSTSSSHDQSKEADHDKGCGMIHEEAHLVFNESQDSATSSHLQGHMQSKFHELELLLDYDDFDYITSSEFLPTNDMLVTYQTLDHHHHLSHISTEFQKTCGSNQELTRPRQSNHQQPDITWTFEEINREYDLWEQMVETSSSTLSPNGEENNEWFQFIYEQTSHLNDFTLFGEVCP